MSETEDEKLLKEAEELPWEVRLLHKNWKVRNEANINLAALCNSITDPEDPRLREFGPFFKNTVADSNPYVQERALDALIAYLKVVNADSAEGYAKEVCDVIAAKCLTGRPKTVKKSQMVFMLLIELESVDVVLDAMEKAIIKKVAKAVVPAIDIILQALREFGVKIVPPKRILKLLPELFDHRDQNVRASSRGLTLELCRWIGKETVKSVLFEKMPNAMKKELEAELVSVSGIARPSRKTRSEQEPVSEIVGSGREESVADAQEIDEHQLVDAVDILTPLETAGFQDGLPGDMSLEEIERRVGSLIQPHIVDRLKSAVWTERFKAIVSFKEQVELIKELDQSVEILVRFLCAVPGWSEKNVKVQLKVIDVITHIASTASKFPKNCVVLCILGIGECVADMKTCARAKKCLTTFSEAVGPGFIFERLYKIMKEHRNPKVLIKGIQWMVSAVEDFGVSDLKIEDLLYFCKSMGLLSSVAAARNATIKLIGALHKFVGPDIKGFFSDVGPAALCIALEAECRKNPFVSGAAVPKKTIKSLESLSLLSGGGLGSLPCKDISAIPTLMKGLESADSKVWFSAYKSFVCNVVCDYELHLLEVVPIVQNYSPEWVFLLSRFV
ncbi:protein MOR1-like isoform X2 [Rhododendron vialii]|uniref:protein MOR1-like isoform X2 n=1 Tax=Rhododendron vialii TaxID=182163 RepID=UPI00265D7FE0|nr:protein MOR1-like isoform X2 [Rhododendron vialii]